MFYSNIFCAAAVEIWSSDKWFVLEALLWIAVEEWFVFEALSFFAPFLVVGRVDFDGR